MDFITKTPKEKRGFKMKEHIHIFGFEKDRKDRKGLYEPKKNERGFSIKQNDWVCRCGITRRVYFNLKKRKEDLK
jgi:hypothetical protein